MSEPSDESTGDLTASASAFSGDLGDPNPDDDEERAREEELQMMLEIRKIEEQNAAVRQRILAAKISNEAKKTSTKGLAEECARLLKENEELAASLLVAEAEETAKQHSQRPAGAAAWSANQANDPRAEPSDKPNARDDGDAASKSKVGKRKHHEASS